TTSSMKRIILTLPALLLACAAHAQFGIRAGGNVATLSTKTNSQYQRASASNRTGYQVGVFYEKKLTDRLSLVPEVQFSRQRVNLEVEDSGIADAGYYANYRLRLSYLNVPVLLRATFGKFYLEAGPQFGIQLAAHETGDESIGTIAGSYESSFDRAATDHYRRVDLGLSVGAGVKLPAGFGFGVRAHTGLLSLTPAFPQRPGYYGNLKNQVVQASMSYQLKPR
ncbi:MAG TPA: porin family protein, partial [Hymenobacter sp.]